jgi:hypothetical protein
VLSAGPVAGISVIAHGTNSGAGGVRPGPLHATASSGSGLGGVSLGDVLIDVTALNEGKVVPAGPGPPLPAFGAALTVSGVNISPRQPGYGRARAAAIAASREGPGTTTPGLRRGGSRSMPPPADRPGHPSALASLHRLADRA